LFGLPVGNAKTVPGLPIAHQRHSREAFLTFDQGQDVLRPQLEVLIDSGGIAFHANYASVHAWHLLKGEYDLPESPGRPDDSTPSKCRWLSLSRAVLLVVQPEVLEAFRDGKVLALRHIGGAFPDRLLELGPLAD